VKGIRVGVDGTDSEINEGLYGEAPQNENFLIIGHESFGVVEEVGKEIRDFRKGDYVVVHGQKTMRHLYPLRHRRKRYVSDGEISGTGHPRVARIYG